MRDINEDLHRNPFDNGLKEIATRFGTLLREIVETIDTYGLKARHLAKHRKPAAAFIEQVIAIKSPTEAGDALKKRIEKNRDKLFTFLDYDGVRGTTTTQNMPCGPSPASGTQWHRARPRATGNTPRC